MALLRVCPGLGYATLHSGIINTGEHARAPTSAEGVRAVLAASTASRRRPAVRFTA